jgi:site-specific DNA-adenine methylase
VFCSFNEENDRRGDDVGWVELYVRLLYLNCSCFFREARGNVHGWYREGFMATALLKEAAVVEVQEKGAAYG